MKSIGIAALLLLAAPPAQAEDFGWYFDNVFDTQPVGHDVQPTHVSGDIFGLVEGINDAFKVTATSSIPPCCGGSVLSFSHGQGTFIVSQGKVVYANAVFGPQDSIAAGYSGEWYLSFGTDPDPMDSGGGVPGLSNHAPGGKSYFQIQGGETFILFNSGPPDPVPEPASWAMFVGGFALLAFRMRSDRRAFGRTA